MRNLLFSTALIAVPTSTIAEAIVFQCDLGVLGFGGSMELVVDRESNHIEMATRAGESFTIPLVATVGNVIMAFWMTPDRKQLVTISLNTLGGDIAITRVGTKEPLLKEGKCDRPT